jgi:hypothetical protein
VLGVCLPLCISTPKDLVKMPKSLTRKVAGSRCLSVERDGVRTPGIRSRAKGVFGTTHCCDADEETHGGDLQELSGKLLTYTEILNPELTVTGNRCVFCVAYPTAYRYRH